MARLAGLRVLEFGLGFSARARILGHDHETEYTLNYLPIAASSGSRARRQNPDDPRSFGNASLPKQVIVLVAGRGDERVVAVFLFFRGRLGFNPVVQPPSPDPVRLPAAAAGLQPAIDRLDRRRTYP